MLFLTLLIALFTLIATLIAFLGKTINEDEPDVLKSITLRGWLSIFFLIFVFVLGGTKEVLNYYANKAKDLKSDEQFTEITTLQDNLKMIQEQSSAIIVRSIGEIQLSQLIENINLENQKFFSELAPEFLKAYPEKPCFKDNFYASLSDLDKKMEEFYWPNIVKKFEQIKEKEKLAKIALENDPLNQEHLNEYRNRGIQAEYLVRLSYEKANDLRIEALKKFFSLCK